MKEINKDNCLAKEYHEWQKSATNKYYSTHKFYKDVLCALIVCQDGLCAYSEYRLLGEDEVEEIRNLFSKEGRYVGDRPEAPIDNEHFDSCLKPKSGWIWENFLGVYSPLNRDVKRVREAALVKRGGNVHSILKPDNPKYKPYRLLRYNIKLHMFFPNPELDSKAIKEVKEMIHVLGLNWGHIRLKRNEYITQYFNRKTYLNDNKINQFYTAINMIEKGHS